MAELECFFDCSSPWTYFAFESLLRMQDEIGVTVQWRPFLVGGLAMWWGFVKSLLAGAPRLEDPAFRRYLRRCQRSMLLRGKRRTISALDAAGAAVWEPARTSPWESKPARP